MHAIKIQHHIPSENLPEIHKKRLTCLLCAVEAAVSGSRLTLSSLGRGLSGQATVKHNIKRIDRLLGNGMLHAETPSVYGAIAEQCLDGISMPLQIIDAGFRGTWFKLVERMGW